MCRKSLNIWNIFGEQREHSVYLDWEKIGVMKFGNSAYRHVVLPDLISEVRISQNWLDFTNTKLVANYYYTPSKMATSNLKENKPTILCFRLCDGLIGVRSHNRGLLRYEQTSRLRQLWIKLSVYVAIFAV